MWTSAWTLAFRAALANPEQQTPAMAIGSVILKPQPVAQPLPHRVDLNDLVVDFIEVFARNPEGAGAAAAAFARVVPQQLEIFVRGFDEKLRLSEGRIRQLFRPYAAVVQPLLDAIEQDRFVDILAGVLQMLEKLLEQLDSTRVAALVRGLALIVERDLGISKQTLRDLLTTLTTQIVADLQRDVIQGQSTRDAMARYEFGAVLAGFKSLFDEEEIELPEFGVELLVQAIGRLWAKGRIDRLLAWLRELLAHREELLAPLAAVIEARVSLKVQVNVGPQSGPVGPGVPRPRQALREGPRERAARSGPPASPAAAEAGPASAPTPGNDPSQPIAWYASWVAAKTLRYSANPAEPANRFVNAELLGITYTHLSKEKMEKLAFHTAWAMPAVEAMVFHMISLEQGDVLSNLHIMVLDAIDFGLALGDKGPIPSWWHWTLKPVMTMFLWGFESGWSRVGADNDPYVWTNAAGDLGEVLLYWRWSRLARELVLSFFTLLNHKPGSPRHIEPISGKPAVRNVERYEGIAYLFWEIGSMIVPAITSGNSRHRYGFVGGGPTGHFWGIAFGGFAVAAAFGYLSIFLARATAGEYFDSKLRYGLLLGRDRLYGPYRFEADWSGFSAGANSVGGWLGTPLGFAFMLATLIGDAPIYAYLFTDGDTDGGEYCTDSNGQPNDGIALQGYPSADSSPYRLPWGGHSEQCVQGNMGVWSHYPDGSSQQAYAYDYSHDVGTEILCSRSGIVTQIDDTRPDNNPNNWNFVEVLHLQVHSDSSGLAAVTAPALVTSFADGTAIPAGTLFPPYWDGGGNPLPGLPNPVPLHPSAAILPGATATAPGALAGLPPGHAYENFNGFLADTRFSFLIDGVDRGIAGDTVAGGVAAPGTTTPVFPAGTSFGYDQANNLQPVAATFGVYGHCIFGFMQISTAPASPAVAGITTTPRPSGLPDVYTSRTAANVRGLYVRRGRVIALSGDTGISAYNHLHVQVYAISNGGGFGWTLPFAYGDVRHQVNPHGFHDGLRGNGVPRSFTFYDSGNERIDPADRASA